MVWAAWFDRLARLHLGTMLLCLNGLFDLVKNPLSSCAAYRFVRTSREKSIGCFPVCSRESLQCFHHVMHRHGAVIHKWTMVATPPVEEVPAFPAIVTPTKAKASAKLVMG